MATRAPPQILELGGLEMVERFQENINGGGKASRKCPIAVTATEIGEME